MKLLTISLGWALGLAAFVTAAPTINEEDLVHIDNIAVPLNLRDDSTPGDITDIANTAGYDPSTEYHGYATAEIWVAHPKVAIGNLKDGGLYGTIYSTLEKMCPESQWEEYYCYDPNGINWDTRTYGYTTMWGDGQWQTKAIRKLLIGAVAGAVEYLAKHHGDCDSNGNCWIGELIRVNFPPLNGKKNILHIWFSNRRSGKGDFPCCDSRYQIDRYIDTLGDELQTAFPDWSGRFHRDTRCIINEWELCP